MNKGVYYAAFTAFLWGFLAIALKVALNTLPPLTVTWFRFSIAFVSLLAYYALFEKQKLAILIKPPKLAIFAAICLGFNYIGYISGINLTSPSIGQIFIQAGPALLALSGFVIFKEKVNLRQGIGLMVVLLGLSIFYNEQIVNVAGGLKDYKLGVILVLLGALAWSGYAVFQKMAVKKHNPMQLNLILFGLPTLLLTPTVAFNELPGLSLNYWLLLIFLGLNTLGAYGALAYALKHLEANKISVIITLNPLITLAVMAWLSKKNVAWIEPESFTLFTVAGATIVILGVVLTVLKMHKPKN